MAIPNLSSAVDALLGANKKYEQSAAAVASQAEIDGAAVNQANAQLETSIKSAEQSQIEDARATEVAEEQLTGGLRGREIIASLQRRVLDAVDTQMQLMDYEKNQSGVDRSFNSLIKMGTGKDPIVEAGLKIQGQKEQLLNSVQVLKTSADNALSVWKTNRNTRTPELEIVKENAAALQRTASNTAAANANVANAKLNSAEATVRSASSTVGGVQTLLQEGRANRQEARQQRLDQLNLEGLEAEKKARIARLKSEEAKQLYTAQGIQYLQDKLGIEPYQAANIDDATNGGAIIALQQLEAGGKLNPKMLAANPGIASAVYMFEQKRSPLQLQPLYDSFSTMTSGKVVQLNGKNGVVGTPVDFDESGINPFSPASRQVTTVDVKGQVATHDPYKEFVIDPFNALIYGKDNEATPIDVVQIAQQNPAVAAATQTQVGALWMKAKLNAQPVSEELLIQTAESYPGGHVDLFKLKKALAETSAKFIGANSLGYDVIPTVPLQVYDVRKSFWGNTSLDSHEELFELTQKGFDEYLVSLKKNEAVKQQMEREYSAQQAQKKIGAIGVP